MKRTRKESVVRLVKDITIGTTLGIAMLGSATLLQGCGDSNNEDQTSQEAEEKIPPFSRPVKTYITEMKPGEFKITDEVPVSDSSQAMAIVRYQNGKRDTIDPAGARRLVTTDTTTKEYFRNPNGYYGHAHHSSLSSVLLWGSMGYMLGRNSGMGSYNQARERQYSSGAYANSAAYSRSSQIHNDYHSHRARVAARPNGGRSGFFSGSRGRSSGS